MMTEPESDAGASPRLILDQFLPYRLSIASNAVSERIAVEYRSRFGLKIPEWRVMAVLGQGTPRTQRDLVAATRMDKVTVNRAAKALSERELVARTSRHEDGRSHFLHLTSAGQSLYRAIVPQALAMEAQLLAGLNADELSRLNQMLDNLINAAGKPALEE